MQSVYLFFNMACSLALEHGFRKLYTYCTYHVEIRTITNLPLITHHIVLHVKCA